MRWYVLRTLLHKELLRHLANRGGLALAALLVVAALLLAAFGNNAGGETLTGGVARCYLDYVEEDDWIAALQRDVPAELADRIAFRRQQPGVLVFYPANSGGIQIRPLTAAEPRRYRIEVWQPNGSLRAMSAFETWFWESTRRHFHDRAARRLHDAGADDDRLPSPEPTAGTPWLEAHREYVQRLRQALSATDAASVPDLDFDRQALGDVPPDARTTVALALVLFALFFACVYLLPSLTCEERERGTLLAQALSPASPGEILAAKFLFYPTAGIGLAAVLAGIYRPGVLLAWYFWASLVPLAVGALGVGLTIACLARTQRAASMGALCYMLAVALLLLICRQNGIPGLPLLALEYHGPILLHAALSDRFGPDALAHLAGAGVLAVAWAGVASVVFRRRGWQ